MAAPKSIPYPHIVRNPAILAGEPTFVGTRIAVRNIIVATRFIPDLNELAAQYPHLTREQIDEALAFYDAHREEIDQYIAENDAALIADTW